MVSGQMVTESAAVVSDKMFIQVLQQKMTFQKAASARPQNAFRDVICAPARLKLRVQFDGEDSRRAEDIKVFQTARERCVRILIFINE